MSKVITYFKLFLIVFSDWPHLSCIIKLQFSKPGQVSQQHLRGSCGFVVHSCLSSNRAPCSYSETSERRTIWEHYKIKPFCPLL